MDDASQARRELGRFGFPVVLKADGLEALPNIKPHESDAVQRQRLSFIKGMDDHFLREAAEPQRAPAAKAAKKAPAGTNRSNEKPVALSDWLTSQQNGGRRT